jgi:hypothetical protein
MKRLSVVLFSLMLTALTSTSAYANSIFDFTFSSGAISASGQFTASSTGVGTYLITGVSGTTNGVTITGVLPPKSFAGNDNVLQDPGPVLDVSGVSYSLANGDAINLYTFLGIDSAILYDPSAGTFLNTAGTVSITSTAPEPGTLALLSTGIVGLAGMIRRRLIV